MRLAVIGTGYVGLVTGTCFAETGNNVVCVDIDEDKVKKMRSGYVPIYEPGLEALLKRNLEEDRLHFTTNLEDAVTDADIIFFALPTPPGKDGSADLSYVLDVADQIGPMLQKYCLIINKSTVPVGTAEKVKSEIAKTAKVDFDVVSNPEFLREGFAVSDFLKPDRVIIGTSSDKARSILEKLYSPFVRQGNPIFFMDERSAEMTKYAANSFLATKISFMNEMANLCELIGADVDNVRLGVGADERIGKRFLFPGIGYGGSCFPKDVSALQKIAELNNYDFKIMNAVKQVNEDQKQVILRKISKYYKKDLANKTFALWGLAFKPDTDDIREAPALEIINHLVKENANVIAYDPEAMDNVRKIYNHNKQLTLAEDAYSALKNADALIIATEWAEFRTPDFSLMKKLLKRSVIFDGRNLYDLQTMEEYNFYYDSIGRQLINPLI